MSGEFLEPLEFYQAKRMDKMHPDFVNQFLPMAEEFYQLTGEPLRVTDTFRTYDEQADLKRRKPYLAAPAGKSNHEKGMAMDIDNSQVPLIEKYGLLEKYGFHRPVLHKGETWHIELQQPGMMAKAGKKILDATASPAEAATKVSGGEYLGPLDETTGDTGEFLGPLEDKPSMLSSIVKNVLQPDNVEFDTGAEQSQRAGELIKTGIDKANEIAFWPITKASGFARQQMEKLGGPFAYRPQVSLENLVERSFGREDKSLNWQPEGKGFAFSYGPSTAEAITGTAEFALAPAYFKLVNRATQVLGKFGKQNFYKYAPDWMFRKGEAGLPEVLPPERISEILGGMSGEERAAMARKYPEFREVLNEWQMGGKVPEAAVSVEPTVPGVSAIGRPQVAGELAEPQAKLPPGQGFELRPKTVLRPGGALPVNEPGYSYPPELRSTAGEGVFRVPPEQGRVMPEVAETIPPESTPLPADVPKDPDLAKTASPESPTIDDRTKVDTKPLGENRTIGDVMGRSNIRKVGYLEVEGERYPLHFEMDNSAFGTYGIRIKSPKGSWSNRMQYKGNMPVSEALRNYQEYLDIDNKGQFKVIEDIPKQKEIKPKKELTVVDEWKQEVKRIESMRFKTASLETKLADLKERIATDPSKWKVGDGVGWRIGPKGNKNSQVNKGFRVIEILPETKEAVIRQVADTGLTSTGGNADKIEDQVVYLNRLVRDKKYDTTNPDNIKNFYAGLPATEFLQYIGSKLPSIGSDLKYPAKVILGKKLGALSRRSEAFGNQSKPFLKQFDREGVGNTKMPLTDNPGMKFASDESMGRPQQGWKKDYSALRNKAYEERLNLLETEGVPLENVKENYFPGMWTQESRKAFNQAVAEWIEKNGEPPNGDLMLLGQRERQAIRDRVNELQANRKGIDKSALGYISRRPFKGKESFRKSKFFTDDIMDAVEFGLEPISTNPVVLDKLKLAEIDRNIMAYQAINEYKKEGMLEFNPATARVPEGKAKIADPFGEVIGPPEPGVYGKTIKGYWVADQATADVLNNYLSTTLYNNRYVGKPFSLYMALGNSLNQFQLGMGSFFHGGFTSLETQITTGAEVIKDLYGAAKGTRKISDLGKTLKEFPLAMGLTPYRGYKLMQEWLAPGVDIPVDVPVKDLMAQHPANPYPILAKAVELAGGGFVQEKGMQTRQSEKLYRDWFGGNKLKSAARSPIAFSELLAKPLMEYWVPAQKAGVFAELVGKVLEANPDKTLNELASDFRQKWNRTDARLGQVRYDRLFVHNWGKNIVQALVRAPGWSGGTLAEVGGAPKDAIEFINEWQKTGKAPGQIPDRVAYLLSLIATTTIINGLLTYAFTGEQPHGMDWWAFRDGGKDSKGRPTRFLLPTYAKDLMAYVKRPVHTVLAKMHPLISLVSDIYRGHDYFNNQFRDPEDSWARQGFDTGKYVLKQYIPFWVRNVQQASKGTGGLSEATKTVISNVGIAPAPGKLSNTPDMDIVDTYHERFGARLKSKAEAEKIETKRGLREIFNKEGMGAYREKLRESQQKGEITTKEMQKMIKNTRTKPDIQSFKSAPLEVQIKAYNAASPERQKELRRFVIQKYGKADPDTKRKFREEFRKIANP